MNSRHDPALLALVRGVLWPGFLGAHAADWLKRELEEGLAGVVYFRQNLDDADPAQAARLSGELRGLRASALIGIDEEGGSVTRLETADGSTLPGHAQLGRLDDVGATRAVGREIGRRASEAGANVVLAPVADVNTNPNNPVIGVRAFGSHGALVGRHVAAMALGLADAGVAACAKHFPGHGDTLTDSHHDLPRIESSWAQVRREHVPPFLAAVEAGIPAIMTAHIVVPELGALPATLNPRALRELREAGFRGAVITDALDMAAIRRNFGSGPGGVRALMAGVDLLCIGNPANFHTEGGAATDVEDYLEVREAICDALDDGTLSPETLERAVRSVEELADRATLVPPVHAPGAAEDLRRMVAGAVTVHGAHAPLRGRVTVLDVRDRATVAVASQEDHFTTAIAVRHAVNRVRIEPVDAAHIREEAARVLADVPARESVVVLVNRIASESPQRIAVEMISARRPDAVVVNAGIAAGSTVGPVAVVDALASSRLTAEVVATLLEDVTAG